MILFIKNMYYLIPLIVGFISLAVFLFFRVKQKRIIAVWLKGFTSLMFITTALVAFLTSSKPDNGFGVFIIIALVFGLLGDVFLDIKYISKNHEDLFTKLGFISFAIGHIFFTTGLFVKFYDFTANILYLIIPIIASIILMIVTLLFEKFTPVRYQKMKPYVLIYSFILFFTTIMYLSVSIQSGWQNITAIIMFGGLVFFTLSDLVLNNTYFAPGFNTPAFVIVNHILYYIGQFAIAISLFFLL